MFGICKDSIKDLAQNFPAVYELMPQSRGFSNYIKKGSTVLSGYSKTTAFLKTLDWGQRSTGAAKPMFTTANGFNNTLYTGSTHIANSGEVPTYKIYGTGLETIKTVCYDANGNYEVQTLADVAPQIFDWLALLNMNVWVILILIVTVAGFNMVSGLLILILDKTSLIGILKALGYKNVSLRKLFLYISAGLIIKGMLWGNVLAFVLAGIQAMFRVIHLDPVTYYMDTVPINFGLGYVVLLNVGVIVVTVLMLIVPTMLISKISPVKAIKFE